jgi:putative ABC transport system ATP-binding protein
VRPSGRAEPASDSTGSPAALLEALAIKRTFHQGETEVPALRGVDLAVRKGEFLAIMGPSGSGKSTLLHILGGIDRPEEGRVLLEGTPISSLPDKELSLVRRRRLGFVLQFFSLLPTLTAVENAAFPLLLDGVPDAIERARESLKAMGLANRLDHRPSQLSGGEQQRVALARALVARPAVILADEPTGNLDSAAGTEILAPLRTTADRGQTIVIVTHDLGAARYTDRVVHLVDGVVKAPSAAVSGP